MGELTPVRSCDGRMIGMYGSAFAVTNHKWKEGNDPQRLDSMKLRMDRPITAQLQKAYRFMTYTGLPVSSYKQLESDTPFPPPT